MRRVLVSFLGLLVGVGLTATPLTVSAITLPPNCRTSVAYITDRSDSGNHGDWATDHFTRTVKICEGDPASTPNRCVTACSVYHADVKDSGMFQAIRGANSPQAGVPILSAVTGSLDGGFSADFVAKSGFTTYHDFANGQTFTGNAGPTTSNWVKSYFGPEAAGLASPDSFINNNWSWTYTTDCEKWVDAAANDNGSLPTDGDITGKTCTTPSSSPSPTPAGTGGTSTTTPGLPNTGAA